MAKYLAAEQPCAAGDAKGRKGCRRQQSHNPFCPRPAADRFLCFEFPEFFSQTSPISQGVCQVTRSSGDCYAPKIIPVPQCCRIFPATCIVGAYEPGFTQQKRQCCKQDGTKTIFEELPFRMILATNPGKITEEIKNAGGEEQSGKRKHDQSSAIKLLPGKTPPLGMVAHIPQREHDPGRHESTHQQRDEDQPIQEHVPDR